MTEHKQKILPPPSPSQDRKRPRRRWRVDPPEPDQHTPGSRHQGNLIGHLYRLVEQMPDAALTHLMAFMAGLVSALLIAALIALL